VRTILPLPWQEASIEAANAVAYARRYHPEWFWRAAEHTEKWRETSETTLTGEFLATDPSCRSGLSHPGLRVSRNLHRNIGSAPSLEASLPPVAAPETLSEPYAHAAQEASGAR